jgi:hypothetical protein
MLSSVILALVVGGPSSVSLQGAWIAKIQFTNGPYAAIKDAEFMLSFNQGGTMTESSNYDGAPPVPPAYGIWRKTGPNRFEAKYVFYNTKPPTKFEDLSSGGGWMPAGKGTLVEKFIILRDGNSYSSTITLKMQDQKGKAGETWFAKTYGKRIKF